jgi:tyrosinase
LRQWVWHQATPKLTLTQQLLQEQAFDIVNELPNGDTKTKFQKLASQMRLPYWDWAMNASPILPTSVSSPTISITYPNGTAATIANPLYQYTFHSLIPGDFSSVRTRNLIPKPTEWGSTRCLLYF